MTTNEIIFMLLITNAMVFGITIWLVKRHTKKLENMIYKDMQRIADAVNKLPDYGKVNSQYIILERGESRCYHV